MSTYREDIAELISAQIQVALEKEYDRGWKECMEYYWKQREVDADRIELAFARHELREKEKEKQQDYDRYEKGIETEYDEDKDPYAG